MEAWIVDMEKEVQQQGEELLKRDVDYIVQTSQITGTGKRFYRVPADGRQGQDGSLYVPRRISIGPYHHSTQSCEQGECDKKQYLINFLSRSHTSLRDHIQSLKEMVDELRDMYDGLDDRWLGEDNKEAFLQMMVVDGCCLLEIMMEAMEARGYGNPRPLPVFNHHDMEDYRHDMLLLDNQIPVKVLVDIYERSESYSGQQIEDYMEAVNYMYKFAAGQMNEEHIMEQLFIMDMLGPDLFDNPSPFPVIHGFFSLWGTGYGTLVEKSKASSMNLLDVYRWGLLGGETYAKSPIGYDILVSSFYDMLPSATQLEEAQIEIRPAKVGHQIVVSFNKRTRLVLQQIAIDDAARSNFHNVVLYERLNPSQSNHFSSYIYFMHCLLRDAADSKLLRKRGILNTTLSDKEVIDLFNNLRRNISFHPDKPMDKKIWEVGIMLSQRYNKNMQMWRKDLFQKYLSSPWAVISVFVAFLILTFTAFQTIYTVLSYYKR